MATEELRKINAELCAEKEALEQNVRAVDERQTKLVVQLVEKDKELDVLRNSGQTANDSLFKEREESTKLKGEVENLRAEVSRTRHERDGLRTEAAYLRDQLAYAERMTEQVRREGDRLHGPPECSGSKEQLAVAEQKIEQLRKERDQLIARGQKWHTDRQRMIAELGATQQAHLSSRNDTLDVFDNTLDQVSEADIKSNGSFSVERLNHAIDDLVGQILEKAESDGILVKEPHSLDGVSPSSYLLRATAAVYEPEEHAQLLMDACLHDMIVGNLWNLFFQFSVATFATDSAAGVEAVFVQMCKRSYFVYLELTQPDP